jgi:hypothetical protein
MSARVVMLLGKTTWIRAADGWRSKTFEDAGELTPPAIAHLAQLIETERTPRTVLVFESETLTHQSLETPRASRSVFASIERIRSEHPVVLSDRLGWGIEVPEPLISGAHSTLMHSELSPGLGLLRDACVRGGSRLVAAWSAYSAAVACLKLSLPRSSARIVVILVDGFVGVAACSGARRSFKSWPTPLGEKDWRAFSLMIGESEGSSSLSRAEVALRRGGILAVTEGDIHLACPSWPEIRGSGRVEAIVGLDALAAGAESLSACHPANLATALPVPLRLDRCVAWSAAVCAGVAVAAGFSVSKIRRQINAGHGDYEQRRGVLEVRLAGLKKNRKEMNVLRNEVPEDAEGQVSDKGAALGRLAGALPDSITLTALAIGRDDTFEMEAMVVGEGVDVDNVRSALERAGFKADVPGGWVYDAASGKIRIHGKFKTSPV